MTYTDQISRKKLYWICQIAGWILYMATSILLSSLFSGEFHVRTVYLSILSGILFLGITHYLRILLNYWEVFKGSLFKIFSATVGAIFFSTVTGVGVMYMVMALFFYESSGEITYSNIIMSMANVGVILAIWFCAYAAFKIFFQHRENEVKKWKLEAKLLESEYKALKAQVNPHFIFNVLNNIRSLVAENPEKARDAITALSKLLRVSFQLDREQLIPVKEEIEIVKEYLNLEGLHLEDRLRLEWETHEIPENFMVPALGIQTLVENAIKHGIAKSQKGGHLKVSVKHTAGIIVVKVINSGMLKQNGQPERGIGLDNLKKRLMIFDERSDLKLEQVKNTVEATLTLYSHESINRR
jgi:two-component system, LytTR family, sensor kinase